MSIGIQAESKPTVGLSLAEVIEEVQARVAAAVDDSNAFVIAAQDHRGKLLGQLDQVESQLAETLADRKKFRAETQGFGERKLSELMDDEMTVEDFYHRLLTWTKRLDAGFVDDAEVEFGRRRQVLGHKRTELMLALRSGFSKVAQAAAGVLRHKCRLGDAKIQEQVSELGEVRHELTALEKDLAFIVENRNVPKKYRIKGTGVVPGATLDRAKATYRRLEADIESQRRVVAKAEAEIAAERNKVAAMQTQIDWFDNTSWRSDDVFEPSELDVLKDPWNQ